MADAGASPSRSARVAMWLGIGVAAVTLLGAAGALGSRLAAADFETKASSATAHAAIAADVKERDARLEQREQDHYQALTRELESLHQDVRELRRIAEKRP